MRAQRPAPGAGATLIRFLRPDPAMRMGDDGCMEHTCALDLSWQGNRGTGTSGYRDYGRDVLLSAAGKPPIEGPADPTFRGDASRWNPEELLLAALAQCHLLSHLHSAVNHGIVVTAYDDAPIATMEQVGQGGRCTSAVLRPRVTVATQDQIEAALAIHQEASENCFIAASMNFPVRHEPTVLVDSSRTDA